MVGETLATYLTIAWLLPLAGFVVEIFFGFYSKNPRHSKAAAWCAVACIAGGFLCSVAAFAEWSSATNAFGDKGWITLQKDADHGHDDHGAGDGGHDSGHGHSEPGAEDDQGDHRKERSHGAMSARATHMLTSSPTVDDDAADESGGRENAVFSGTLYRLAKFGNLEFSIDYYIDSLTLVMFMMVTLIATCIHLFAMGYMGDELTDDYVDHFAHTADGSTSIVPDASIGSLRFCRCSALPCWGLCWRATSSRCLSSGNWSVSAASC